MGCRGPDLDMLGHDVELEGTGGLGRFEVLSDATDDTNRGALVQEPGAAHGKTAVGDHRNGRSGVARGEREGAAGDAVGAGRSDGRADEVALEKNAVRDSMGALLCVGADVELVGAELENSSRGRPRPGRR